MFPARFPRILKFLAPVLLLAAVASGRAAAPGETAGVPETAADPAASGARVVVIPVEGEVDYGLYAFLKRATAEALGDAPDHIVYKINTYGGELHSAFEIVDLLLSVRGAGTWVYVEQKAISAGALIALAGNRIAMGEGTTIGDCAPIMQSSEGIVMLGEKIQSPLRARFRGLAERNGYPVLLSQAMVTAEIGVIEALPADAALPAEHFTAAEWAALPEARRAAFRSHRTLVREGELLTMTDREAEEHGFSQGSYPDFERFLRAGRFEVVREIAPNWSERMVRAIGKVAPLLMLLGFGALYMEFKTPGLSLFGAVGVLLLAVVFGAKYTVGLADHTELLLLLGGFALFLVEIYVLPGTFIAGALGLLLMIAALTLSLQGFTVPDPELPWEFGAFVDNLALTLGMAALGLVVPLLAVRYLLPLLPRKASVVLDATLADARSAASDALPLAAGDVGVTCTGLRPTGKAAFGGATYEVASRGELIGPGVTVEVVRVHGRAVTVKARGEAA